MASDPVGAVLAVLRRDARAELTLPSKLDAALPLCWVHPMPGHPTYEAWGGRTLGRTQQFDIYCLGRTEIEAIDLARDTSDRIDGAEQGGVNISLYTLPVPDSEPNPRAYCWRFTLRADWRR